MSKKYFTAKEWFYWLVRQLFGGPTIPFLKIANWATDRLNKSYFRKINN